MGTRWETGVKIYNKVILYFFTILAVPSSMEEQLVHLLTHPERESSKRMNEALGVKLSGSPLFSLDQLPTVPQNGRADGGVYALYFTRRDHPLYGGLGRDVPIYVGKAMARINPATQEPERPSRHPISTRVAQHRRSIEQVCNLSTADFGYRYLDVHHSMIAGTEMMLIQHYRPLWNNIIKGFGNHAPGKGRSTQKRSPWDTLHPGRAWAVALPPAPLHIHSYRDQITKYCLSNGFMPLSYRDNYVKMAKASFCASFSGVK